MLVDIQIAKPQVDYKREQLSRSFKSARRTLERSGRKSRWLELRSRKPSAA